MMCLVGHSAHSQALVGFGCCFNRASLLLICVHGERWGVLRTHLVIVPTSVLFNAISLGWGWPQATLDHFAKDCPWRRCLPPRVVACAWFDMPPLAPACPSLASWYLPVRLRNTTRCIDILPKLCSFRSGRSRPPACCRCPCEAYVSQAQWLRVLCSVSCGPIKICPARVSLRFCLLVAVPFC